LTTYAVAPSYEPIGQLLTADEYDALPENPQRELVDGVIHVMATPTPWHQDVVDGLKAGLVRLAPRELRVTREIEVRLADLLRRNPDVLVVRADGFNRRVPFLRPEQVVLAVEVVSPGSESADRLVKPIEYARAGIPHYWRIETSSPYAVDVYTYRLAEDSRFAHTGTFAGHETINAPGLEWASFGVADLIDED
jgi:Uma2 family endonuclease